MCLMLWYGLGRFFSRIIWDFGRNIYTIGTYEDIASSKEYLDMGIFPYDSSIKLINGTAVIKIGY